MPHQKSVPQNKKRARVQTEQENERGREVTAKFMSKQIKCDEAADMTGEAER